MEDGVGGGGGSIGRASTSYEVGGGRRRFTVELRPEETTIVSWKKLIKDATSSKSKSNSSGPGPGSSSVAATELQKQPPPLLPHDPQLTPGQPAENEVEDAPPGNRLNAVIEKIERLYVGQQSDDEKDLNNFPEDDEYDTEDSFIDDTELDEYFQVDNSAIKHDGFFVNRGKLERIEPTSPQNQQPKKRRRKELAKGYVAGDNGHSPALKVGKKAGKSAIVGSETSKPSHGVGVSNVHLDEVKIPNTTDASEMPIIKRAADTQTTRQPPPSVSFHGDSVKEKDFNHQKSGVVQSKYVGDKSKDGSIVNDTMILNGKSSFAQERPLVGRSPKPSDGIDHSVQQRDDKFDGSGLEGKNSIQTVNHKQRKQGSIARPKGTMLEKAIRDLEKMVAESRPANVDVQGADNSSQAIKRGLPPEIKQKLAKVARLAQASHGKISKELINHLMSIVGHLIQLRSLKRNLNIMVDMGLSAKQEKDNRVQQIKREVAEMIKLRIPFMKSKALERQTGASDDFQESAEEKEAFKRKHNIDVALEDKIYDLYNLFVEGLDGDAGPQVRKLYAELAAFWPNGFMDNHDIKLAVCRARDRRRALHNKLKVRERIRKNKLLAPIVNDTSRVEAGASALSLDIQEKLVADTSTNNPVPSTALVNAAIRLPVTFENSSNAEQQKQEKSKGVSGSSGELRAADVLPRKKVKRKPESELSEGQSQYEKLASIPAEKKNKTNKHTTPPKSNLSSASCASKEQLT